MGWISRGLAGEDACWDCRGENEGVWLELEKHIDGVVPRVEFESFFAVF